MRILQEFKEFAVRGNVMDMAVGVIVGAAFGTIVTSAVADVLMPPIGWISGGVDFKDKAVTDLLKLRADVERELAKAEERWLQASEALELATSEGGAG